MENPLYRSKSYFSGRNLAKFHLKKKKILGRGIINLLRWLNMHLGGAVLFLGRGVVFEILLAKARIYCV
jgi:hypothetical protein